MTEDMRSHEFRDGAERPFPKLIEGSQGLTVSRIGKSFRSRPVVRGVSLTLKRGEVVGPAGPQRRRQDHLLLHDHRPDHARLRHDLARRPRHHAAAHVSPRAPRHRLPAAGSLDLPRPDRRGEHPRRRRTGGARCAPDCASAGRQRCWRNSASPMSRNTPAWRCRAASAAASRSRARLATHPSYILLDEPFAGIDPIAVDDIRDLVQASEGSRHRRADHRPQCARGARHHRPRLHPP